MISINTYFFQATSVGKENTISTSIKKLRSKKLFSSFIKHPLANTNYLKQNKKY